MNSERTDSSFTGIGVLDSGQGLVIDDLVQPPFAILRSKERIITESSETACQQRTRAIR